VENVKNIPATSTTGSGEEERGIATLTFSEGKATVDQTSITGVKVEINDPSAANGQVATVSSVNYGTTQPPNTGNLAINGAIFYDVRVVGQASYSPSATVTITLTNTAFTSEDNNLAYWDGNSWIMVPCTFTAPNTITASLPASALTGTPIAVGKTAATPSASPLLIVAAALAAAVVVALSVGFVLYRKRGKTAVGN
jgi:hypothetical protein